MSKSFFALAAFASATLFVFSTTNFAADVLGYTNTPYVPGQKWHVHDPDRPRPKIVTPGATFSQGATMPSDALVLFDGIDLSKWKGDKGEAKWKVVQGQAAAQNPVRPHFQKGATALMPSWKPTSPAPVKLSMGYMEAVKGAGNIRTKEEFGNFQLHLEFATPAQVSGNSQGRGNSGVIIFGKYEVQVLDSFNNLTYPDGQCGALYGQFPPLANASKPPGEWQSYDIIFEAPRWDTAQKLTKPANVTVIHNGVVLHHRREYLGTTSHQALPKYEPHPEQGAIELQDHGNPMRFRNIWTRKLGEYDQP